METTQIVNDFIQRELLGGKVSLTPGDDLLQYPQIDSLGVMGLVTFLEQEFAIQVPPEHVTIENFRTVSTISTYVDSQRG